MQRNLTLTEELERLEQSITLTLQGTANTMQLGLHTDFLAEIDSNFSRAHRIVTTSILPIVEQYTEHSKDVWEGAKVSQQPILKAPSD
jgi:DASH complex subunit ASK1